MTDNSQMQIHAGPTLEIRLAADDSTSSTFEGYLARYGEVDASGETFAPGAFSASLARLAASGVRLPLLWQHDQRQPIGSWTRLEERADGVWGVAKINTDVLQGRNALALIQAGDLTGLSVGFVTKTRKGDTILTADLMEASTVSIPAAAKARIVLKDLGDLGELAAALQAGRPMSKRDAEFVARRAWPSVAPEQNTDAFTTLAARLDAATLELKNLKGK